MFHEFASSTNINSERAKHALALAQIGLSVLFVLDIDIESFTLKEYLQISIVLENWMAGNLV